MFFQVDGLNSSRSLRISFLKVCEVGFEKRLVIKESYSGVQILIISDHMSSSNMSKPIFLLRLDFT